MLMKHAVLTATLILLVLSGLSGAGPASAERKILYYRNPMGLPDTSAVPKKDPMGMDYIPVYADEVQPEGQVKISPEKIQTLGVRTETARLRTLTRAIRVVGTVQVDERRLYYVSPRFQGWVQQLYVNTVGQTVRQGDPLLDLYSPDIIAAEREYLMAAGTEERAAEIPVGKQQVIEGALQRLRSWEVPEDELQRLRKEGKPRQLVTLHAPASGVVLEKHVVQGMRFMPGEALYHIADLSSLWVLAEVYEQDLSLVQPGQTASIRITAYPDKVFTGKVTFIYPTVNPQTRTVQVRIELPNPDGLLKPSMYANVELAAIPNLEPVLVIPNSAVLYSGIRQVVLLDQGEGRYQPRQVKLGRQGDNDVQVLEGLAEGDKVVVSANFLIDAESNLRAALGSFGEPAGQGGTTSKTSPAPSPSSAHQGR
jgi:Cu(I)/Ag(I) efflux system membrane fusion protein